MYIVVLIFGIAYFLIMGIMLVSGVILVLTGKRRFGAAVLTFWALCVFGPIAQAEWRAFEVRSELHTLREIPDELTFQGATVAFTIYEYDHTSPCSALCHIAMQDGNVTVYGVLLDHATGSEGLRREDLYHIIPNPQSLGHADRYFIEPVAEPEQVDIDYLHLAVFQLQEWYHSHEGSDEHGIRQRDGGAMVLDGWPGENGQIVANLTTRAIRVSGHGQILFGQPTGYYPDIAAQLAAEMRILCGHDVDVDVYVCRR